MTNTELLPCPFCGVSPDNHENTVSCSHEFCCAYGVCFDAARWNTRAQPQNVDGFSPDWKCRPDCVAHEVMKEWLEHGHAPNSDELAKRILSLISPPPIDVEALKREVSEIYQEIHATSSYYNLYELKAINFVIDHLASAGYLRAPLPRIDGLEEAIEWEEKFLPVRRDALMKAGRAYLKASGV